MKKHYMSILAFATLLCMMLFGAVSCKKDDTLDPNDTDYFIDVAFLPETETNGEAAPRLLVNFNDELAMIEIRPPADTLIETVLFLCPDHKAFMMCGNENLLALAEYDMDANMPSRDMLLVTPMDDNSLLLTKGFIDWNTNTMATGDMMVLPIDGVSKNHGTRGNDEDMRLHLYNHLVKPLTEEFEYWENFSGAFGQKQAQLVFMSLKYIVSATAPRILFSDNPELIREHMIYPFTLAAAQGVQTGMIRSLPVNMREAVSRGVAFLSWHLGGGHGKIDDYEGENGEEHNIPGATQYLQAYDMVAVSTSGTPTPMYIVDLNVGNVTENSAYLKGSYRFVNDHITPVRMGYIIKVSGGPEQTQFDMNFQGTTITSLQKATKYTAFAYVESMGEKVLSPGVTFWTLGFEAFPTSLTFPAEGDTKNVALSYSHEDITSWDITSKPSWCTTYIDDLGLLAVTVGATTETRSGTITITAHSKVLGTLTQDIAVTQFCANHWDGTAWSFTGPLSTTPSNWNWVGPKEFTLMANNVSNKDITFNIAQYLSSSANNYNGNYILDGNENLIYTASGSFIVDGKRTIPFNCQITFVRTGQFSATADFYYEEPHDGTLVSTTGLLQGTLTNAKEIGDYETTTNFSLPFLITEH